MSPLTPLGFTREYQAYRAANTAIPFPDSRLLAAVRFWSRFPEALASDSYSSFWLEDLPPLFAIDARTFDDLHPNELTEVATFIAGLEPAHLKSPLTAASLWEHAARKWLYVGEAANALDCLAKTGLNLSGLTLDSPGTPVDPHLIPKILIEQIRNDDDPLGAWLTKFDADWLAIRESGHTNQVTCVLVESNAGGKPVRGRLRTLEAHIEALPKGRDSDEVVFGHQLCTADDPQVHGAYAAVASLRHETQRSSNPQSAIRNLQLHFRARFTFANDNREPYGGDSLAFACFTAAYGDWWSKDLHRERRLVAAQVALTGALTSDGQAESVAENSLEQKIERVFFSPLSSLVVPQPNRAAAEATVAVLHSKYPNRRLRIITAERSSDLISDGNITIPERVCLGEYAVRAAAKYTKSAKVQVPLLAALCYLLLCLVYPKSWVGFDRNPGQVLFTGDGVTAQNYKGQRLWSYDFGKSHDSANSVSMVANLDADNENELLCLLSASEQELTNLVGAFFAFDNDGTLLFERSGIILGEYPGDTSALQYYQSHRLAILHTKSGTRILTGVSKWYPARNHWKIWDTQGNLKSTYINAGQSGGPPKEIVDSANDILHIAGLNNRTRTACLCSIHIDSTYGVSPPYVDEVYDLSNVRRGNQIRYLIFQMTDLCLARTANNNDALRLLQETPSLYRVDIEELGSPRAKDSVACVNYYFDSQWKFIEARCEDSFRAARNQQVARGRLDSVNWEEYQSHLSSKIQYWADTGWVGLK